jgi:glycosyltransferase involved in cell wall biosynthesis
MAAGLAVVATDVGGNREALGSDAGIIVHPGDALGIAESLSKLALDPALRETYGRAGFSRVSRLFIAEKLSESLVNFYRALLKYNSK